MHGFFARKRNIGFLFLTIALLSLFSWFVVSVPPDTIFSHISLYVIVFGISFFLFLFIFADIWVSSVYAGGIIIYLFLRFLHLRHPLYAVLLFICCIAVVRLISAKKLKKTE